MRWEIRPLGPWLGPVTGDRKSSGAFKAHWDQTLALLDDEVEALGCDGPVVIQIDVLAVDLRADGMLRTRARVGNFPGVIVSFKSRHGPLRYATDAYEQRWSGNLPGWQANVRAIALSLEALRAVDRYGVSKRGEQYTGWSALPAARAQGAQWFTEPAEAESWMLGSAAELGVVNEPGVSLPDLYRRLAKQMHPDVRGDSELWERLDAAATLLELRKNEALPAAPQPRP
jgi:hypothetical protein